MNSSTHQRIFYCLIPLFLIIAASGCSSQSSADQNAPSRVVQNKGSDTMVNLALAWAEAYRHVDPTVSIAVTGGGSGTGVAAIINGTVDIANASRQIKDDEIKSAQKNGFDPVEFVVAIDALAVIVNPKNPVDQLTIAQLSDIFTGRISNWKEVGGNDAEIVLVSREGNSGTYVYFLEKVVRQGDSTRKDVFAPRTLLMTSSVGIIGEVSRNPNAIGYDGLGYITKGVKTIAVAQDSSAPYILPSVEAGADGSYPLARNLYMYTAGQPNSIIAAYLDWIRGPDGQKIVVQLGFVPIAESRPE
jgi:phosphate transport system substrate-binding protein